MHHTKVVFPLPPTRAHRARMHKSPPYHSAVGRSVEPVSPRGHPTGLTDTRPAGNMASAGSWICSARLMNKHHETCLRIKKLSADACVPQRQSIGAAGYDLHANTECRLAPQTTALVPTGVAIELPCGSYGRVAPRSSFVAKHNVTTRTWTSRP